MSRKHKRHQSVDVAPPHPLKMDNNHNIYIYIYIYIYIGSIIRNSGLNDKLEWTKNNSAKYSIM